MKVSLSFEVTAQVDSHGRKTGQLFCEIGGRNVWAASRDEMKAEIAKHIETLSKRPEMAFVRVGDQTRILVGHAGAVEIFCPCDEDAQGLSIHRHRSSTWDDIVDTARGQAVHLAQQAWRQGDEIPAFLNDNEKREFEAWVRFQIAYRIAAESGCAEHQCHALACEAM